MKNANIATLLTENTLRTPYKRALVVPAGKDKKGNALSSHLSFIQLDNLSTRLAAGLRDRGIIPGTKTIVMLPPGRDFFITCFALFKAGIIPVMVDPGMGLKRMLNCLALSKAEALIGIPKAQLARKLFPKAFSRVKFAVSTNKIPFMQNCSLKELLETEPRNFETTFCEPESLAAILFTTGSTGPAKGVAYSHGNFHAQIKTIKEEFNIQDDDRDLPSFPLFALFNPALGITSFIPEMDPRKPGKANPRPLLESIRHNGISTMFCSPALLNRLGRFGIRESIKLPSLRCVVCAGAPVRPDTLQAFAALSSNPALLHTPYGATEAVPFISIAANEILSETRFFTEQGMGICIGKAFSNVEVRIIPITDRAIEKIEDSCELPEGEIGEIIVKGPMVTEGYFENPEADRLSKIKDKDGFWHRMGDLAWKDNSNRFWFCGRKSHRVSCENGELYTIPCESIFNTHEKVKRSALVGIGPKNQQTPVIIIETKDKKISSKNRKELKEELLQLAKTFNRTSSIKHLLFHNNFPVDIRHNAKIYREELKLFAEKKISLE